MLKRNPRRLGAAERKRLAKLFTEFGIDQNSPDALGHLALALDSERPPPRAARGRPYERLIEDFFILEMMDFERSKQRAAGVARPSIKKAAEELAKMPKFKSMSAHTIRKRFGDHLRRLRCGNLQPQLEELLVKAFKSKVEVIRQQARARQDEK